MDDIPERPCPPSTPGAFYGLTFVASSENTIDSAADYFDGTGVPVVTRSIDVSNSQDDWTDSQRVGYSFVYADDATPAYSAGTAGHVFGILGAEYDSSVEAGHRWKNAADTSAYLNYMQVSVFPIDVGYTLAAGEAVTIAATAIPMNTYTAPTPTSAPSGSFTEIEGAAALVASTMALGALAATLY